jgi:hypothetical protein
MNFDQLARAMSDRGVTRLYAKLLSPNDNSKNQPYFGGDWTALNMFPISTPVPEPGGKRPNFKAALRFSWMDDAGNLAGAPHAKLILYPDYPEVRFSGYLRGCSVAPTALMGTTRESGRVLFLGIHGEEVIGYAAGPDTALALWIGQRADLQKFGVFLEVPLPQFTTAREDRLALLAELCRIRDLEWIVSKRLKNGECVPCAATQCGGYTLEAELNISPNGRSDPDYRGWEIKAHAVTNLTKLSGAGAVTLMTPEPTGGVYKSEGIVPFIDAYGYSSNKPGHSGRRDFNGAHRVNSLAAKSQLTLTLIGYAKGTIVDPAGCLALIDSNGKTAASWAFADLINHWKSKHSSTAFVPYMMREHGQREYRYGEQVRLGTGADFLKVLAALDAGLLYYDPGIWYETTAGKTNWKKRSQFRVSSRSLGRLYTQWELVGVCEGSN